MRENMKKEWCADTIKQLGKIQNCILRSDRGSQYASGAFRSELKKIGITQSLR